MRSNPDLCEEGIDCRDCKHCDNGTVYHSSCGSAVFYECDQKDGEVRYIDECETFDPIRPELVVE